MHLHRKIEILTKYSFLQNLRGLGRSGSVLEILRALQILRVLKALEVLEVRRTTSQGQKAKVRRSDDQGQKAKRPEKAKRASQVQGGRVSCFL